MTSPLHVRVTRLASFDGWHLQCVEHPAAFASVSTLEGMGPVIADAVARATDQPDAAYLPLIFEYPAGNPTIFHVGRDSTGLLTCHEIPSLRLEVESGSVAGIVELIARTTNTQPEAIEVLLVDD